MKKTFLLDVIAVTLEILDMMSVLHLEMEMNACVAGNMKEKENILRKYYKTADDEEPICCNCDYQFSDTMCVLCGPEHSWNWYKRSLVPWEWENEKES